MDALIGIALLFMGIASAFFFGTRKQQEAIDALREDLSDTPTEPQNAPVSDLPAKPVETPMYDWSTVEKARHSVRLICDEEGLTTIQKNQLCATVGAESGWQSYYLAGPKKGQPVTLDNYKNGHVWSTDYGISQINSYYWIGPGKQFPSAQYVLDNPEACIRWMCKCWKQGKGTMWVAFKTKSPLYKQYYGIK